MKQKLTSLLLLVAVALLFSGCGANSSLSKAGALSQCEYDYKSISNLNVSGMNLSNGISITNTPKLIGLLTGTPSSIPMGFTMNLNVKNNGSTPAVLSGMNYVISIDDIQFSSGNVDQRMNIAGGETQVLPVNVGVDLISLMSQNSKSSVENMAKNFIGLGSSPSNVKVQLRPTFMIGGIPITSPIAIPIGFTFGGK